MGRLIRWGKFIILGAVILFISCPLSLEDNLTEVIADEVHLATASEYTLTIETPENGIISLSGSITVKDNISQEIIANPYQSHAFLRWEKVSGPGNVVFTSSESSETSFVIIGGDIVIKAVFEERPRVRYSTPTSDSVGINANIYIKVSKELDVTTINPNTVRVLNSDTDEPVSGSVSYSDEMILFNPDEDLKGYTYFSITLSKAITDANGIAFADDYLASPFRTRGTGDNEPPIEGEFQINTGQLWSNSNTVTLTNIFARETDVGSSVAYMYIKNESGGDWSDPFPYNDTVSWSLSETNVLKTVFMQFEDASGNISDEYGIDVAGHVSTDKIEAEITLDTIAPLTSNEVQTSGENGIAMDASDVVDGDDDPTNDMYTASQNVNIYLDTSDAGIGTFGNGGEEVIQLILAQDLSFTQGEWNGSGYDTAIWEDFTNETTVRPFTVDPNDGSKIVLVKFRDSLGNESSKTYDYLKLDQTAPTGALSINNGDQYTDTDSDTVSLTISAQDTGVNNSDITAAQMMISNSSNFLAGGEVWENVSLTKVWNINPGDGSKTVYIKFKDSLGNSMESADAYSDTITLDTSEPTGSIVINGGDTETGSKTVSLTVTATDTGSNLSQMAFNFEDDSTDANWVSYSTSGTYTIPEEEWINGDTMSVYAFLKDNAGNESSATITDVIDLNTTPPDGTFNIDSDSVYTNDTNREVDINMNLASPGNDVHYRIANTSAALGSASWEVYGLNNSKTHSNWTLATGEGTKTVYVQFRTSTGIVGAYVTDTIILDVTAPFVGTPFLSGTADDNSATRYSYATINSSVSGSPVYMSFKNESAGSWSGWYTYNAVKTGWYLNNYNTDGVKTVYFKYRDAAGNETTGTHNDTIILDKTAPSISYFRIGGPTGPAKTGDTTVTLYSSVSDAGSGMYQMNIGNSGDAWNGFETYDSSRTNWALKNPGTDEEKKIYCYYKDKAGNTTSSSNNDTITLDTTPPQDITIKVNNDRQYAYSRNVTLSVSASDVPAGSDMRFYLKQGTSSSYTYTSWESYGTSKTIALSDLDELKYVYVQFRDELDNTTTVSSSTRDTITLDRPSIDYVTKGKPGDKGKVQVFVNTVLKATGENVLYRVLTSPTSTGTKTDKGYVSTSGGYVSVDEEINHYFFINIWHYYDGSWKSITEYYQGAGGISRRGYAADVTVVYDDDDTTDTTLAGTIRTVIQSNNGGTEVSSRNWASINKSVMLWPEDSVSSTYSAENTIHGDPVILTPSTGGIRTYAGKIQNISAHGRGVIAMGNDSWALMQSISSNFSLWEYTGQQPYSIGTTSTGTTTYDGPWYYRWNTTDFESPWKYPLWASSMGGENPTNNYMTQLSYSANPWSISSKYISNDADPVGGEIYGRVYGSGNAHHFGIIRQGRFLVFAFDSIPLYTPGEVLFVNLVDKMNRNF
jgi:Bacterial Ig-like domain